MIPPTPDPEARCPYCGKEGTSKMVVGKTQTFIRGVRTTYDVLCCACGKTYRGKVVSVRERAREAVR